MQKGLKKVFVAKISIFWVLVHFSLGDGRAIYCCMYSFGYFPGVRLWFADVSGHYLFHLHRLDVKYEVLYIQPLTMELIEGPETSANHNRTPGKYPKEYIQDSKHGESLK